MTRKPQNKEDAMIKFWLNVTEGPVTNMEKRLEMGVLVDGVKKTINDSYSNVHSFERCGKI